MLEVSRVTVRLGGRPVLAEVSLDVAPGAFVGVIGPNGAGKSTLARAVAGLVVHDGEILVADRRRDECGARAWARLVAYVPQRPVLPGGMTVTDYVLLGRSAHHPYLGAETARDRRVAAGVLERLDLGGFARRTLAELSGGESQRVVLARALVQEAPVLVMDEPTTSLDLGHSQRVLALTDELRSERALSVLCTLHDLTLAGQHADRLVVLRAGAAIAEGTPAEVLTEALVATVFDADVEILAGRDGPIVVPRLRPASSRHTTPSPAADATRSVAR